MMPTGAAHRGGCTSWGNRTPSPGRCREALGCGMGKGGLQGCREGGRCGTAPCSGVPVRAPACARSRPRAGGCGGAGAGAGPGAGGETRPQGCCCPRRGGMCAPTPGTLTPPLPADTPQPPPKPRIPPPSPQNPRLNLLPPLLSLPPSPEHPAAPLSLLPSHLNIFFTS